MVKHLPAMWETQVQSLGQEAPLEKEMATHSTILAWRIPWTEEPGGLQSLVSQRVGHDWATSLSRFTFPRTEATRIKQTKVWGRKIILSWAADSCFYPEGICCFVVWPRNWVRPRQKVSSGSKKARETFSDCTRLRWQIGNLRDLKHIASFLRGVCRVLRPHKKQGI